MVIFSTLLKLLISVAVEKSETKPFYAFLIDRLRSLTSGKPHMLYMAGKLMTSTTRVIGNLLLYTNGTALIIHNLSSNKVVLLWKLRNTR